MVSAVAMLSIGLVAHLLKATEYRSDATRNFFGVLKIEKYSDHVSMLHGGVTHGNQWTAPERRKLGTTYYSQESGIGLILKKCRPDSPLKVGLVGLGAGTSAVYGQPGDHFRFYEINPEVVRFAKKHFTYLVECSAKLDVVLGDARLQLEQEPPQEYDVLVLDAFSGDGVPVHLLTSEAFDLYRRHLRPNGVIAAHVTNRHLDLRPVLRAQAERLNHHALTVRCDVGENSTFSLWVLMTNDLKLLSRPEIRKRRTVDDGRKVLWTDARSDLVTILEKRQ